MLYQTNYLLMNLPLHTWRCCASATGSLCRVGTAPGTRPAPSRCTCWLKIPFESGSMNYFDVSYILCFLNTLIPLSYLVCICIHYISHRRQNSACWSNDNWSDIICICYLGTGNLVWRISVVSATGAASSCLKFSYSGSSWYPACRHWWMVCKMNAINQIET